MIVVSDAGPLMALGKTGGLGALFRLFPSILTPTAVYEEVVTAGLRLGAPDALLLQERYQSRALTVQGGISREEATEIDTAMSRRPDIWISPSLCARVLMQLERG